jgi:hypothetical protein
MPCGYLLVSLRYPRSCSFPGPRRRRLVFLCFSLGKALAADWQQHFLLSRCGLAWHLALRWFSPAVVCDAAFQGIHQVDYVFALWPRLCSNGLATTLLINQFGQRSFVMILKFFGLECGGFLIVPQGLSHVHFPPTSKRPCLCPCPCYSPN